MNFYNIFLKFKQYEKKLELKKLQKDKLYGALIFLIALILLVYLAVADINIILAGANKSIWTGKYQYPILPDLFFSPWVYVVGPLMLAEILIFGIAAWIGWTMMTTPPPVPLEELEGLGLDDEDEEKND